MSDYMPGPYTKFRSSHPEVARAFEALGEACHEQGGPLEAKVRHLIKLGIATAVQSEGSVKSHARQAMDAGASAAEVQHAVLLTLTTAGFPRTVAAMGWVDDVLQHQ